MLTVLHDGGSAFRYWSNFRYADTVVTIDHDHLAARECATVDEQFHRLVNAAIQFDHRSDAHADYFPQRHTRQSKAYDNVQFDFEQPFDVPRRAVIPTVRS